MRSEINMIWKILIIISLILSAWSAIGVWYNTTSLKYHGDILKLITDNLTQKKD